MIEIPVLTTRNAAEDKFNRQYVTAISSQFVMRRFLRTSIWEHPKGYRLEANFVDGQVNGVSSMMLQWDETFQKFEVVKGGKHARLLIKTYRGRTPQQAKIIKRELVKSDPPPFMGGPAPQEREAKFAKPPEAPTPTALIRDGGYVVVTDGQGHRQVLPVGAGVVLPEGFQVERVIPRAEDAVTPEPAPPVTPQRPRRRGPRTRSWKPLTRHPHPWRKR
jgi:hypothetical protein